MDCSTFSFDLHVLGTPPALILSQDQTLNKKWTLPITGCPAAGRTIDECRSGLKTESTRFFLACSIQLSTRLRGIRRSFRLAPSRAAPGGLSRSPKAPVLENLLSVANFSRGNKNQLDSCSTCPAGYRSQTFPSPLPFEATYPDRVGFHRRRPALNFGSLSLDPHFPGRPTGGKRKTQGLSYHNSRGPCQTAPEAPDSSANRLHTVDGPRAGVKGFVHGDILSRCKVAGEARVKAP